nr:MAG TPA: hypothetical protein [Caudoviricetes sp.]
MLSCQLCRYSYKGTTEGDCASDRTMTLFWLARERRHV